MRTLLEVLKEAEHEGVAIGHFNVSDLVGLKAISSTARDLGVPVIVGVSEGEREFIGVRQIAALVKILREESPLPVFLNADHTHSLAKAEEAARAGFDMIIFDGSALTFEDNVRQTKTAVETIKNISQTIFVEGEIGFIGSSSEIHDKIPTGFTALTTPQEAREFAQATGIDVLAPAVGNMHGLLRTMVNGEAEKRLQIGGIAKIKEATGMPLTLHGGSGTRNEDLQAAIKAGINIIHINTELRLAWRRGIEAALNKDPEEIAPHRILPVALKAMAQVLRARLELFNNRQS